MALPFTRKILRDWAGWKAFRDGKILFDRGVVEKLEYEHPFVSGQLAIGIRGMRCKFEILDDGFVENLCPCRDNQEKGLICAHMVALGLEAVRRYSDPLREAKAEKEKRRAQRQQEFDETKYIKRVPQNDPNAISAVLRITLKQSWREHAVEKDEVPLRCAAEYQGRAVPLNEVPKDLPLAFSSHDENLLFVLEDISEGPAKGKIIATASDFINILRLRRGCPLYVGGVEGYLNITSGVMQTYILMRLNKENGELILSIHPRAAGQKDPLYISDGRIGWMYSNGRFIQLEQLLPGPLREIYKHEIRIPRGAVPAFMEKEYPNLIKSIPVETRISPDLFTLEPAEPRFRLVISGSRASLSAKLYAEYGNVVLRAAREEPSGHFAIPDPDDLLAYRVRNLSAEKKALKKLAPTGFRGHRGDVLTSIIGVRDVLNFLGGGVPKLRRFGWRVELEGRVAPFMDEVDFTTPVIHVNESSEEGFFEVGYEYENSGGQSLTEGEIQRALNMGDAYVEKNGRTILLDIDAIETAREVFDDCAFGEGSRTGSFRMNNIYSAYVQSSLNALDGVDVEAAPGWMQKARELERTEKIKAEPLGDMLENTLRFYQKEGVYWLRFLERSGFSGILADEMGLGKTIQTLTWLQMERHNEAVRGKPALIVCPTSLVDNWWEEAAKFTPDLRVLRLHGANRHEHWAEVKDCDLVVTSYALLRRDLNQYLEIDFSVAVLDEAQHIKNRSTQNAKAAKKIKAAHKVVLTGTPIENSVADLWSIMDFLMPGYLSNHKAFREHYELPIGQGGPDADLAQMKLRRKLHPFLMRRLKKDVAKDLPDKIQRVAHCTLSKDQHMVYRELLENAKRKINDMVGEQGFNKSRMQILKTLLRLRQTCCHLDLLKLPNLQSEFPSAKMELFFELVDEALDAHHRILVFSQFTSMLGILRGELEERGLKYCYLDGATKNRQEMVKKFNTDRSIPIFLISLKAGGSGLNLTGADMVIHYDPWWNPAVEDQATDRAHRIGQKNTVYSVKLITKNSVEEKVLAMQQRKKSIIDATLAKKAGDFTKSLTWDDVQELLTL